MLLRILFALLAVVSLVLGWLGFTEYLKTRPDLGDGFLDVLYYDLQLFVLDSAPVDHGGPYPVMLEIARFSAPAVAAYALVEAARLLFADQLRRFRIRMSRDHSLICGAGAATEILADRLTTAGERVVTIASVSDEYTGRRRMHLSGDPRHPALLRAAGVGRAKALYALSPDSAANAAIALAARRLPRSRADPLAVHVHVENPDLCQGLRARQFGLPQSQSFRLDFFNASEVAARVLLEHNPLDTGTRHLLIVGLSPLGRMVLLEVARQWRLLTLDSAAQLTLTVVDRGADAAITALRRRYAFLQGCRLVIHDTAPEAFDVHTLATGPAGIPDRTYFCHPDPDQALHAALTNIDLWSGAPESVVVGVEQQVVYGKAFDTVQSPALLDRVSGVLRIYGVLDTACDPALIGNDLIEQLARAVHEHYVVARSGQGERISDNPSMAPWHALPETLRRANRSQAIGIGTKLEAADCVLAPRVAPHLSFSFTAEEIERLARIEHRRWLEERKADGWTYAPARDDAAKQHPNMVEWQQLNEDERGKDRDAVRALPNILADAGFQIVRLPAPSP